VPKLDKPQTALELGRDHVAYGQYALGRLSPRMFWAISVGADRDSPSLTVKGDPAQPNEDGLLAAEVGDRALLAVADGHFGQQASHELLEELAARVPPVPGTPEELVALLRRLAERDRARDCTAGTSLLVAIFDRATREGFGLSFGDSTFAVVGAAGHRREIHWPSSGFVSPERPASLNPRAADRFTFRAAPGELLLVYTDGINECHYREPKTSVTPELMGELWLSTAGNPESYVRELVELALAGVGGHPGGQDNLAVVALQA
jgi:serine/threonine protein phosphatase PrpC